MKPPNPPIEDVLLDVRKAYRLLHSYQRMVLDALLFIGKQFGLEGPWGTPLFSDPSPRADRRVDEKWSWDWLNLVCYEFRFGNPFQGQMAKRMSVFLISDTGLLNYDQKTKGEPDSREFKDVSESSTQLVFVIWEGRRWKPPAGLSKDQLRKMVELSDGPQCGHGGTSYALKHCPLSRLANEDDTRTLVGELVKAAKTAGVVLEAKTNSIEQSPEVPN